MKKYTVTVFDRDNKLILTKTIEADSEVAADSQGYNLCYTTSTGNSYDVVEEN